MEVKRVAAVVGRGRGRGSSVGTVGIAAATGRLAAGRGKGRDLWSGMGVSEKSKDGGWVEGFVVNQTLLYIWMSNGDLRGCGRGAWEWFKYRKSGVSTGAQGRSAGGRLERFSA
jgi:hypothetical protein